MTAVTIVLLQRLWLLRRRDLRAIMNNVRRQRRIGVID
jgi:hypothetical protein